MAVSSLAQAQEKKIDVKDLPAAVTAAFQKSYPKAAVTGASTEVENGKTMFEIESREGTINRDLLYTDNGEVFEIEENVTPEALPAGVKSSLEKQFTKYKLVKGEKVTRGAKVAYELKLKSGKKMFSVLVDDSAKIVKCVTIKGKKEKEKD
jgi:hypothetical protein